MIKDKSRIHFSNLRQTAKMWSGALIRSLCCAIGCTILLSFIFIENWVAHAQEAESAVIGGNCGPLKFNAKKGASEWVISVEFTSAEVATIAPSDEEEGHVVPAFISCEAGSQGHYLIVQFEDPLMSCAKCSVIDVYTEHGERLEGVWEKIYTKESMLTVFQMSFDGARKNELF